MEWIRTDTYLSSGFSIFNSEEAGWSIIRALEHGIWEGTQDGIMRDMGMGIHLLAKSTLE